MSNEMYMTISPAFPCIGVNGEYTFTDWLFFRKREDADAYLAKAPHPDGHRMFKLEILHNSIIVQKGKRVLQFKPGSDTEAEAIADKYNGKMVKFQYSWLE